MTELLAILQEATAAIDSMLSEKSNSEEIQYSAIQLRQKIDPCFKELYRSANTLQDLLQPCFDELAQAEAVWNSKLRIAKVPSAEIREHMGVLSGYIFKLERSKTTLRQMITEQTKKDWYSHVETIKRVWFVDLKSGGLRAINFSEKDKFIRALNNEIGLISTTLNSTLKEKFQPLNTQLKQLGLDTIAMYIDLLDARQRSYYDTLQMDLNLRVLSRKLEEPYSSLPPGTQNPTAKIAPLVSDLINQGFLVSNVPGNEMIKSLLGQGVLPLTWDKFFHFSEEVGEVIERIVYEIIEDRIGQILKLLKQSIRFYDDFLEKQQRYQEETPEQREAEHDWLVERRHLFDKVKNLNALVLDAVG